MERAGKGWPRAALCVLLLALLAVCGAMGASRPPVSTVSVPVTRILLEEDDPTRDAGARLAQQRQETLAMLDAVLNDASANAATRESAAAQRLQIAAYMDIEAQTQAVLAAMGIAAQVVCGAQMTTIIAGDEALSEAGGAARVVDAVCAQTGAQPEQVKIILTKNDGW